MGGAVADRARRHFDFEGVKDIFSIKGETKSTKLWLLAIVTIYFALCVAYFCCHSNTGINGDYLAFDNDDSKYLRSAWTLLETGKYTYNFPDKDTVFIMPGLTTVLAGFVWAFGRFPLMPFSIFQALLGCVSLYLIFLCARWHFNARIGLIAAGIMALYGPSIYITGVLLTESFFYTLFLLTYLFTLYAVDTGRMRYYAWGGVFLGLCVLFRPIAVLYPLAVLVMWLLHKYPLRDMIKFGAVVTGIVCVILSPWIIRNAVLFGEFIPLTKSSGNPALQGTFIYYDQTEFYSTGTDYRNQLKAYTDADLSQYNTDEQVQDAVDRAMVRLRFKEYIVKKPVEYFLWYVFGKTVMNFGAPMVWMPMLGISRVFYFIQHQLLLLVGILGFAAMTKTQRGKRQRWFPAVLVLWLSSIHLPYYCFARYVFPVMFGFAVYGAFFIDRMIKQKSSVSN